ncbi:uncharacterized protein FOMMEDRAFT_26306 [Fomitiporia mediterranea MF3/22]|uniref:uncharacterized protein n=1 Tax=Fomitiporia mediterranea (strain MF3/22) TaxID=694068 RepID=UPI000440981E|nr:uncharacterized protein FOMMEDRAFT_26306 [Fomitiporia mediterranea MF3/22]EJD05366.1 hypothetical protein FOMMEDRAFT_26306 [Fomitiporia mediterranea MF3/22]
MNFAKFGIHDLSNISVRATSPEVAITFEKSDQLASYFGMAATCLLTYDIMATFDKEIHYFWKSTGLTRWVFFLNRYIGFYAALINTIYFLNDNLPFSDRPVADSRFCAFAAWTHQLAGWMGIVLIDGILLMRVLALCPDDKKIARFLVALFAAESIVYLGLLLHIEVEYRPGIIHVLDRVYCGLGGHFEKQEATGYWVVPLFFEIVLLTVAIRKSITYWGSLRGLGRFKLAYILLRDQIIYFVMYVECHPSALESIFIVSPIRTV